MFLTDGKTETKSVTILVTSIFISNLYCNMGNCCQDSVVTTQEDVASTMTRQNPSEKQTEAKSDEEAVELQISSPPLSILLYTDSIETAKQEIRSLGGRISHIFGNSSFVACFYNNNEMNKLKTCFTTLKDHPSIESKIETKESQLIAAWKLSTEKQANEDTLEAESKSNNAFTIANHINSNSKVDEKNDHNSVHVELRPIATSLYMRGSIALGLVYVSGPKNSLKISEKDVAKRNSDVMKGMKFLTDEGGEQANMTITYDVVDDITIDVEDADHSSRSHDDKVIKAAVQKAGFKNSQEWVDDLKERFKTQWAYLAFIVKYNIFGGSYYAPYAAFNEIRIEFKKSPFDRTFAHETCHVFGAADEYSSSGCDCKVSGHFDIGNYNCRNCDCFSSKHSCLMDSTSKDKLCTWTRGQIGWRYFQWGITINDDDDDNGARTKRRVSMSMFMNKFERYLFMAWKGKDALSSIFLSFTYNPDQLSSGIKFRTSWIINKLDSTESTPAMVFLQGSNNDNNKLVLIWRKGLQDSKNNPIYFSTNDKPWNDENPWPQGVGINQTAQTNAAPTAAVYNGVLYIAWKSTDGTNRIYITGLNSNNVIAGQSSFPQARRINDTSATSTGPKMVVFNDMLYLIWVSNDDHKYLYISGTKDPLNDWPRAVRLNDENDKIASDQTPTAMVVPGGKLTEDTDTLHVVWKDKDSSDGMFTISTNGNPLGGPTQWTQRVNVNGRDRTKSAPALAYFDNGKDQQLACLAFKGYSDDKIYISTSKIP